MLARFLQSRPPPREFQARTYRDLLRTCELFAATGQSFEPSLADQLDTAIHRYAHPDGGFGINGSSLDETRAAAESLRIIGKPASREDLIPFVHACEDETFGFTGKPGASLGYLEYLSAGVSLCALLDIPPTYPDSCRDNVRRCQQASGGFARTETGIATLDNTFHALHALMHLSHWEPNP
ncbi:MAG: prenyltransferase/squalene oxidase repeat-containing protein [Thermodesulfobacteriota bacterium]